MFDGVGARRYIPNSLNPNPTTELVNPDELIITKECTAPTPAPCTHNLIIAKYLT